MWYHIVRYAFACLDISSLIHNSDTNMTCSSALDLITIIVGPIRLHLTLSTRPSGRSTRQLVLVAPSRSQRLSRGRRLVQEFSKPFLSFRQSLLRGGVGHVDEWSPKVEREHDICGDPKEDQEYKVHRIAKHCHNRVLVSHTTNDILHFHLPATISFQPSARRRP